MVNSKGIYGMHVGIEEICVSRVRNNQCEVVFRAPACLVISETGEVIAGRRAMRYAKFHEGVKCHEIDHMITYEPFEDFDYVMHKGVKKDFDDLYVAFFKDIKYQLEKELGEVVESCVVSSHYDHLDYKEKLKRLMAEAGFKVIRILSSSAACAIAERNRNSKASYLQALSMAAERHTLTVSLIEFDKDVGEAFYSKHFFRPGADSMNAQNLMRDTLEMVHNAFPEYEKRHKEAEIHVYGQRAEGMKKSLSIYASEGAAVIAGQLMGGCHQVLYLDVIESAYGIEIVKEDGTAELPFVWIIDAQTTVPILRSIECKPIYNKSNGKLRIYTDSDKSKSVSEMLEFSFDEIFKNCFAAQNVIGISMSFDANKNLTLGFSLGNGQQYEWRVSDAYPVCSLKRIYGLDCMANEIEKELYNLLASVRRMSADELRSPAGMGLEMIEKQVRQFMKKYEIEDIIRCLETKEGTKMLIEELLVIVDNIEYGVRAVSKNSWSKIEIETLKIYHRLLKMLEKVLYVVPIPAEGLFLDTDVHYAMYFEKRAGASKNLIIDELQKGYYWFNEVLRPAKVKVAE